MSNINTLFRKGYLLAGVLMAANMLAVNEVRATENNENNMDTAEEGNEKNNIEYINDEEKIEGEKSGVRDFLDNLNKDDAVMFMGGLIFSVANNYFKWWSYDSGIYCEFGCVGWRSKRLLNDIFQFEVNLNIGRGISWSILGYFIHYVVPKRNKKREAVFHPLIVIQGFVSVPLAIHISNFSISISLDSIIWMIFGKFLGKIEAKILEAKIKK